MTVSSVNIVVPLKNEDKSVDNLIKNLVPVVEKINKKINISLIDDHSSDQTWDALKKLEQKFNFIKAYQNERPSGIGNAIKFGIEKNSHIDNVTEKLTIKLIIKDLFKNLKRLYNRWY